MRPCHITSQHYYDRHACFQQNQNKGKNDSCKNEIKRYLYDNFFSQLTINIHHALVICSHIAEAVSAQKKYGVAEGRGTDQEKEQGECTAESPKAISGEIP